ncbi:aldehyde oxidase GLOX [Impatiens glandulifera]|uniref:aldehyde oxidase GLOX n=1 Tax=Impatiens glandulifera TaxID=253017 RepID=UPI001FB0EE52|nr:aldehyde oxidase GLOX [Impatiens glandulifera]
MHMQLIRSNQIVMFDRTDFGRSNLSLPKGVCRHDPHDSSLVDDCTAHSILYDIASNTFRPLFIRTDTWCSSGSVLPGGTLVQTGGYNDGDRVVRMISPCRHKFCDWSESSHYLLKRRWYASNQILPDGRIIIVGGRRQFNYEFFPRNTRSSSPSSTISFSFLQETRDPEENNLYPFLHLLPDGNLFVFANTRAISLDYRRNRIVKEFPSITRNDPRNYPSSGSSVLLPIDDTHTNTNQNKCIKVEVMICGGAPRGAFGAAGHGHFTPSLTTCGRIQVMDKNPRWAMETMPIARVMGDMILLPNLDVLIINGAQSGTAGWNNAGNPATRPLLYKPESTLGNRFSILSRASRPRMYHSSAILIPDGRVIVGGSNPHTFYNFSDVQYPTDLSLEAFSPPYLAANQNPLRPRFIDCDEILVYKQPFSLTFEVENFQKAGIVSVVILAPPFTTHSYGMNQRMVRLRVSSLTQGHSHTKHTMIVLGPSIPEIAPSGYYLLFVIHAEIPSSGLWVKVQQ